MKLASQALPLILLAVPATAQTALLREGDPGPSGAAGQVITGVNNTAVNQAGGYAVTLNVSDGTNTTSQVWGNLTGGPGAFIREEGTFGNLLQVSYESFFGISAGSVVYSPSCTDSVTGTTGLDGVWLDDVIVGIEEMMIPGTAEFISFGSRPGATNDGIPYFVGGITDTAGGSTQDRALFFGAGPTVFLRTGDLLPNTPAALSTAGIDFDFRFSSLGTHSITPIDLDTTSADDGAIAIDGSGLLIGGALVQESFPLPPAAGGIGGENWDNFDFCGITEAGDYMFTGDTDGDTNLDEYIFRNGSIWAREGDMLDGQTLAGSIEGAFLNENNQLAFIWDVEVGGTDLEALYFEDQLILLEGDEVDWDGDGSPDAGITLENFTGISALTLGADGTIYFTADVNVAGTLTEGYFVVEAPAVGTNYCTANANASGLPAMMTSTGSASLAANDLVLQSINMPDFAFAFFITSLTQDFVMNPAGSAGNLCLGGDIGRGVGGSVFNTGSSGMISASVDWTSVPQPSGAVAAMVGDTWNFQCWMRDSDPMGMATSNFSDGYAVTVQ